MNKIILLSSQILLYLTVAISIMVFAGCANIVPPSGGPMDKNAPRILSITPGDSSLNQKIRKIDILFDKYMVLGDLSTQLSMSPSIEITPTVNINMKKVTITIADSLLTDNTTYTLSLGNALKDNREGTSYPDFTYSFSTGSYFDSLSIKGRAFSAEELTIDTGLVAVMYDASSFADSQILKKKPLYTSKVDASGSFRFNKLPNKPFRVFILKDIDKNRLYTPGLDEIGFVAEPILPQFDPDTVYSFMHFLEEVDSATAAALKASLTTSNAGGRKPRGGNASLPKLGKDELYRVLVDTTNPQLPSKAINENLTILIAGGVKNIDKEKIFLSFEKDQVDIESISKIQISDSAIVLQTEWQDAGLYTLRLVKGWATDSSGRDLVPGRYTFKTMSKDNYGIIRLVIPGAYTGKEYLLQLIKDDNTEVSIQAISDSTFHFDLLNPGNYSFRVIEDTDQNGRWTSGDYFKKRQAEKVILHNAPINLKPGWDMEVIFAPASRPVASQSSVRTGTKTENAPDKKE